MSYAKKTRGMLKLLFLLLIASPAAAQQVTPNFTQGSMQSTTTTTVDITRTIETEIMGGDYKSWSGTNVTPSGDILSDSTTYSVTNAGEQFQLETVVRDAGVVESISIDEVIESTSVTTSLSVFSQ